MPKSKNNKNRGKTCGTKTKINEYPSQSHGARKKKKSLYLLLYVKSCHTQLPPHDYREHYRRKPTQFPTRGFPVVLDTSQIKPRIHPQHESRHPPRCIRRHTFPRSKGTSKPRTVFPILALRGIVSPDQKVAAVLQHRLYPTMSRGYWCFRCCCCCCCSSYYCCYCRAAASSLYSSGPPVETLYRDQRGGLTPLSRRRFC